MLFESGHRPDAGAVARASALRAETTGFSISNRYGKRPGQIELLAMGLTYDLSGLAPGESAPFQRGEQLYGCDSAIWAGAPEAIRITPGPHLGSAARMPPVLRVLAGLGTELARLPGLRAVSWGPAQSWMSASYFSGIVRAWLLGGAFPALGLTALLRGADGNLLSRGLSVFAGFEIELIGAPGESPQERVRLASRLIHVLATEGEEAIPALADEAGHPLQSEFDPPRRLLRLWRTS